MITHNLCFYGAKSKIIFWLKKAVWAILHSFNILFAITAAGVVPCGDPKKSPRTSSIVQIIFLFWSFEINGNSLRIQKLVLCLEPYILDSK